MRILDLSLTYHWYDMIASGVKKEEYREIKPFYVKRLTTGFTPTETPDQFQIDFEKYDAVRFHRGQGGQISMLVECKGIRIGKGNPSWGAPEYDVFIISLGEIYPFNSKQYYMAVGQVQDMIPYDDPNYHERVKNLTIEMLKDFLK